jgi:hypothetical protein
MEQSNRREQVREKREKWQQDNLEKKQQMAELNQFLKNAQNEN